MKIDKTYLISGLAVFSALAFLGYTKYKNAQAENTNNFKPDTSSDSNDEPEQATIPNNLATILTESLSQINSELKGKSIATKLSNVNARFSPKVNDGFINNSYGPIGSKNTFVGKVTSVVEDSNKAKNASGKVYKWLQVKLSTEALAELNLNPKSFSYYTPSINENHIGYFREDTIILI